MISLGEFILLSLIVISAVLATVYLNRKLKEKGYKVNNLLNFLAVLTVSTALCLVGTSVAWILKGVAFALILLYASVEDFTKREADENIDDGKAITVTLLVTPEQAEPLSQYESVTSMHFVLVYRGDKATADEYIKVQDDSQSS